jgi:hypothetical protein
MSLLFRAHLLVLNALCLYYLIHMHSSPTNECVHWVSNFYIKLDCISFFFRGSNFTNLCRRAHKKRTQVRM